MFSTYKCFWAQWLLTIFEIIIIIIIIVIIFIIIIIISIIIIIIIIIIFLLLLLFSHILNFLSQEGQNWANIAQKQISSEHSPNKYIH